MELVALGGHGGRRTEGALRQEERELGLRVLGGVGRTVLVEVTGGSEDVEGFLVGLGETLLALEDAWWTGMTEGSSLPG